MEVVWLSDRPVDDENAFVLVLQGRHSPLDSQGQSQSPLGPISHFGFALPSLEAVDAIANEAKQTGLLEFGPTFLNPYAGYLCLVRDPDGHNVEFSHGHLWENPVVKSSRYTPMNKRQGRVLRLSGAAMQIPGM